jgi:anti-sigma factor RsiW
MVNSDYPQLNMDQLRDLLSPYLDGQVTDKERTLVEQALAVSPELRRELEALRRTIALVAALPPVSAPRPFTLTEADVRPIAPRAKGFLGLPSWAMGWVALAATLLCVLAAGGLFWTMQFGSGGAPAMAPAAEVAIMPTSMAVPETEVQSAAAPEEPAAQEEAAQAVAPTEAPALEQAAPVPPATREDTEVTLTEPSLADETAEAAPQVAEAPVTEGYASTEADQAAPGESAAGATAVTATPTPATLPLPTPTVLTFAAPVEAPTTEAATGEEALNAAEAEQPTVGRAEAPAAADQTELELQKQGSVTQPIEVLPTATPSPMATPTSTETPTPPPSPTSVALLTLPAPLTPTTAIAPVSEPPPSDNIGGLVGTGIIVVILVVVVIGVFIGMRRKRGPS